MALDLSTWCGWAAGEHVDGALRVQAYGTWRLGKTTPLGELLANLRGELSAALAVHAPDVVVYESPLQKDQSTARALICLGGVVELVCRDRGVRVLEDHSSRVRKHVLGKGGNFRYPNGERMETKDAVMAWARDRGFDPADHNAADALVMLQYLSQRMVEQ